MLKRFSILWVLVGILVLTHTIVPHHHHHDRIYLLMEENHEHHDGNDQDENKCHHGFAVDEVLVCASSVPMEHRPFVSPLHIAFSPIDPLPVPLATYSEPVIFGPDFHIAKDPPPSSRTLRAPPSTIA